MTRMAMTALAAAMPSDDELRRLAQRIAKDVEENHMSPKGALGLPPLLDERRLRYGIPDEAFEEQAIFDRIFVWGIEEKHEEGETFAGTSIIKPETSEKRILHESTRGVLFSAGLKALDILRSNGIGLGHIVGVVRLHPWHKVVGVYGGGHEKHKLVLRCGDLVGSEDLGKLYREGKVKTSFDATQGKHVFEDDTGMEWDPMDPTIDDSY